MKSAPRRNWGGSGVAIACVRRGAIGMLRMSHVDSRGLCAFTRSSRAATRGIAPLSGGFPQVG